MANEDSGSEMYSDAPASATEAAPEPSADEAESQDQTATIPKALCPGMEAGSKIVLTIEKVLEDEYLVSYDKAEEEETEEPEAAPAPAGGGPDDISGMMQ